MLLRKKERGLTLVELIVAVTILAILAGAAVPLARTTVRRAKERELRRDLWQMRDAIYRYKEAADRGAFQIKVGTEGYPPDLGTLGKGVDANGKKLRFLRRIPVDPLNGKTGWGLRPIQEAPMQTPGEARTSSTFTLKRREPRWTERNIQNGKRL